MKLMIFEDDLNEQLCLEGGEREVFSKRTYQWIRKTDYLSSSLLVSCDLEDWIKPKRQK